MNSLTRRRFLQSLGLGAGASLLMPISDLLLSRALGAEGPIAKRLILMNVYMFNARFYTPEDAIFARDDDGMAPMVSKAWPDVFDPLSAYMSQAVLVDGARNYIGGHQHRAGTSSLSCVNPIKDIPEKMGPAGNATIDQHIAKTLSRSSAHRSVLWGVTEEAMREKRKADAGFFASGRSQGLSHFTQANEMLDRLFPDPNMPKDTKGKNSFRPLRDRLLEDLGKLKGRLAAEERLGLESYEAAILEFDKRQEAISMLSCDSPPGAPANKEAQDHLMSMMSQSMLALQCGLTQVIGISIGHGRSHDYHMPVYRDVVEKSSYPGSIKPGYSGTYGHGEAAPFRIEATRNFHQLHFKELARVMDALAQHKEHDGSSALDHTAVIYSAANGSAVGSAVDHHAKKTGQDIWPVLLLAGKKTAFRTGGRYMSCSRHESKGEKWALSDIYKAVAQGLGVNPAGFGDEAKSKGVFSAILS